MSRTGRGGVKPGDPVTISALAARDGSASSYLQEFKNAANSASTSTAISQKAISQKLKLPNTHGMFGAIRTHL
jgi:hypothetical protein